jgi:hypothetical protein
MIKTKALLFFVYHSKSCCEIMFCLWFIPPVEDTFSGKVQSKNYIFMHLTVLESEASI